MKREGSMKGSKKHAITPRTGLPATNHTADRYNLVLVRCGKNTESLPGIAFSLTS